MPGFNRNIAVVIGGLLLVAVVIVAVIVVRQRSGLVDVSTLVTQPSTDAEYADGESGQQATVSSEPLPEVDREAIMRTISAPVDVEICGNRVCGSGETVESCSYDCLDRSVFDKVRFGIIGDTFRVTWETSVPMTSEMSIGASFGSYEAGTYNNETLKTEHTATFTGLVKNEMYFVKISGKDEGGRTSSIEGHSGVFD